MTPSAGFSLGDFAAMAATLLGLVGFLAQSGDSTDPTKLNAAAAHELQAGDGSFQETLWNWLEKNSYRNWASWNGPELTLQEEAIRRTPIVKTYANRLALSRPDAPPLGSIIVAETYGESEDLDVVIVMYRAKAGDAANPEWYRLAYNPDGTAAKLPVHRLVKPQ